MENLFQALASLADGAFIINKEQRIIYWNEAAQKILGYSDNEVISQPCYEIFAGRDDQCQAICHNHCRVAVTAFAGGTVKNYDMCVRTKLDGIRWINISTFPFPTDDIESSPVLVHLFRDATQKKQAEQFIYKMLEAAKDWQEKGLLHNTAPSSSAEPAITELTHREREVLSLLAQGRSTTHIAQSLSISPATVRNHIRNIRQKLQVHTKLEAVVYAINHGLVP
jgi:PAS domain S-box-containing protein